MLKATTLVGTLGLLNERFEQMYFDRLVRQTQALLEQHKHEIDLVASELMKRGRLSGRDLRRLLFSESRRDL